MAAVIPYTMAFFGESEKGRFHIPHYCDSLEHLVENLGNPPPESKGLYFAVQALLYDQKIIFYRVEEEGFSYQDYFEGLRTLRRIEGASHLRAICMPGVGDEEIFNAAMPICEDSHSIIITTESDLYDYLHRR